MVQLLMNPRLGMLGWTPKFEDDMNGNLGVWDTLEAIRWTKKYVHKFGGDPDKISVIGQSSGAQIITWLLLGKEGRLKLPFDQAWIASPTIAPRRNLERSRPVWDAILNATGCPNIACMRTLPFSKIRDANAHLFIDLPSGPGGGSLGPAPGLTPTVDGELLNDLPLNLFEAGKFNKGVKTVVVGNTANEGLQISSDGDMPARFPLLVRANIPNASDEVVAKLLSLFPYPPENPGQLAEDLTTTIVWACSASYIADGYKDRARRFVFSVPPSYHGMDLACEKQLCG